MDLQTILDAQELAASMEVIEKTARKRHEELLNAEEWDPASGEQFTDDFRVILERVGALRARALEVLEREKDFRPDPKRVEDRRAQFAIRQLQRALDGMEAISRGLFSTLARLQLSSGGDKPVDKYKAVAVQMRRMRVEAKKTMEQLAEEIDATKNIINHVENSRRTTTLDILTRWALACGYHLEFSLYRAGDRAGVRSAERVDLLAMRARTLSGEAIDALLSIVEAFSKNTPEDQGRLVSLVQYFNSHKGRPLDVANAVAKRAKYAEAIDSLYDVLVHHAQMVDADAFEGPPF